MDNKKKLLDLIVIGSGLASLNFVEKFLEKNKRIEIISPNFNSSKFETKRENEHIFKILPPQMLNQEDKVRAYFDLNKIHLDSNCKLFGSLEFGGLSNYWGLQIDPNISRDLNSFKKKTKKKILKSFDETIKKFKLFHEINYKKETKFDKFNSLGSQNFKNNKLILSNLILGFQNFNGRKKKLESVDEIKDKFDPKNFYNKYLKRKKIIFHNYFVEKIIDYKKGFEIMFSNGSTTKKFYAKKIVLGTGTIISTKLILNYLNIKKEIKLKHHPRLFSLYFSKKPWKNKMLFQPPQLHLKPREKSSLFTADFRPGNKLIIESIIKFKKYLLPFQFILNFMRFNMIFSNIFLHPKFSDIYLKLRNDNTLKVFSKNKNIQKVLKFTSNMVYSYLRKGKNFLPFKINYFPGFGADFHYFGTIPVGGKSKMSVNENCQLKSNKNIYIIDGSVFNFQENKYPLGIIIANARRVAKDFF